MLKLEVGNSTLAMHKESGDGGEEVEGEDAVRMGVKQKSCHKTAGSIVTHTHRMFLHPFLLSSNNYELSP